MKDITVGLRLEGESVAGDGIPFFAYPFPLLREIPAARYQGENMVLAEMELRWKLIKKWSLVFFFEEAKVFGKERKYIQGEGIVEEKIGFLEADTHVTTSTGFRYELGKEYGLWVGLDFATSEAQDFTSYVTVGSTWSTF